jgi:hypothetical protein
VRNSFLLRAPIFFFALVLSLTQLAPAQNDWVSYKNKRFGYNVSLPPGLLVSNRPADGSGLTWQTGTVRVQVSGANNPYNIKPNDYFERVRTAAGDRVVTESKGSGPNGAYWYQLLFTKDGRRVHQKVFISSGSINTAEFSYAYRYREEKESLGAQFLESFQPGDLLGSH